MAGRHAADEAGIRQLIDKMAEAIRAMDFEGLKACFAMDMVSFDVAGPPLQTVGADAKLKNWEMAFAVFQPPLGYEIRDLTITVGNDVAFGHSFNRFSGTLENGTGSVPGFGTRPASRRSTATGSSRTTRSRFLSILGAAERW
jgi:ketosteroid isomerase-like protein